MNPKPSGLADVVIDGATWMAETIRQELDGAPSACDVQSNPEARGWAANVAKICVPGVILGRGFLAKVVPNASARRWMGCASAWPHWRLDEPGADETPRVDAALPEDDLPAAMIENHTHTFTFTQSFTPRRIHGGGLEWRHTHGELEAHGGCRERYGSRVRDNDGRRAPTEIDARW